MDNDSVGIDGADAQPQTERMVPQSEVNKLIGNAKFAAEERARQQAEAEFQKKLAELQAQKQQAASHGNDTRDIDVDSLYQQVHERFNKEMQQRQLETHMREVADSYTRNVSGGSADYEDFDDVIKEFNPAEFPQIVYLVAKMGNAKDIVYELSKNPQKLATIDYLAQRSPRKAQVELERIGKSIEANKEALAQEAQARTNAPLDRMQPSTRAGSNGQMSVSDLRSQPWLRG